METVKCQLNDIISDPTAKAATMDISNMNLESNLPEAECVRFRIDSIPEAIVIACGLKGLATKNRCVHARVNKEWCGLEQAGKIAHDDLVKRLDAGGCERTPIKGHF